MLPIVRVDQLQEIGGPSFEFLVVQIKDTVHFLRKSDGMLAHIPFPAAKRGNTLGFYQVILVLFTLGYISPYSYYLLQLPLCIANHRIGRFQP
ncbi:hypothetical protein D3C73_1238830 [compost metagenome]